MIKISLFIWALSPVLVFGSNFKPSDFESRLKPLIESKNLMGVSIGLFQNGRTWKLHLGATMANGPLATDQTKYELASVTKLFTGTLAAMAVNENKLDLLQPAQLYLPEYQFPSRERAIRVLDLLTHRAGFDNKFWYDIGQENHLRPWELFTPQMLVDFLDKYSLLFSPGSNCAYDNIGTGIAALVLEKIYSKEFKDILHEKILAPVGMSSSEVHKDPADHQNFAQSYRPRNGQLEPVPYWFQSFLPGFAGLNSNTEDMLKFIKKVLNQDQDNLSLGLSFAMIPRFAAELNGEKIGLLWRYLIQSGTYWHNGATYGMNSFIAINPKQNWGFVILANTGTDGKLTEIGMDLINGAQGSP